MKQTKRALPILVLAIVWATSFGEQRAWAGGTHFLVQLHGGFAIPPTGGSDLSLTWGFLAGYGGRWGSSHLRFYGLFGFDRASFTDDGVHQPTGRAWSAERSNNDFQVGLRLLLPVWWRLRWYAEVLIGASYLQGELQWGTTYPLQSDQWSGLLTVTTGFEVRYHQNFATGIRGEMRWLMNDSDPLPPVVGQEEAGSLRFTVLATQAFLF